MNNPEWLRRGAQVAAATEAGRPIVALESAVLTHGLPRPINLEMARRLEAEIQKQGVTPAIIAVLAGEVYVGLEPDQLEQLAVAADVIKISTRDIAVARTQSLSGGTTVAASVYIASAARISVFATGGIGGVHRGDTGDISADLPELARTPIAVVCSGAKSILDLPRTLEWLETAGIPVVGWQTDEFPAFFSRRSGLPVHSSVSSLDQLAAFLRKHREVGLSSAVLVCVPCPAEEEIEIEIVNQAVQEAEAEANAKGLRGNEVTPYLLSRLSELTDGASLRANLALLRENARIAASIAKVIV
jgi:pseudouridine-5'-phosphate glycosidase